MGSQASLLSGVSEPPTLLTSCRSQRISSLGISIPKLRIKSGRVTLLMCVRGKVGCLSRLCWICSLVESLAGPQLSTCVRNSSRMPCEWQLMSDDRGKVWFTIVIVESVRQRPIPETAARPRHDLQHEPQRRLLGQRCRRKFLRHPEEGTDLP